MAHSTDVAGLPVAKALLFERCPSRKPYSLFDKLREGRAPPTLSTDSAATEGADEATDTVPKSDRADDPVTIAVCEELGLVLSLAAALDGTRLCAGSCTELRVQDPDMIQGLEAVTTFEPVRDMLFATLPGTLTLIDMSSADTDERKARRQEEIDQAIRAGTTVLVITTTPAQLDTTRRARIDRTLDVTRPGRQAIRAILQLIHPDQPAPPDDALPGDEALQRLVLMDVMRAVLNAPHRPVAEAFKQQLEAVLPETSVVLEDVIGHEAVKAELQILISEIDLWRRGDVPWKEIPNGITFHGPPGTGKTLLARALAGSAALPIVITSYGEAIATSDRGSLGPTLARLFAAFEEARRKAPAVLFIDELDGFGSRESASDHNSSYQRGLVTGFLRLIDTVRACEGVVLIGATNALHVLDEAVRRPGRFDRLIAIGLPGKSDILAMLRSAFPIADHGALTSEADHLLGTTPAQISSWLRQARRRARADGRDATLSDLSAVRVADCPPAPGLDLARVAIHEVGHLLVGHHLGLDLPDRLVVSPHGSHVAFRMPQVFLADTLDAVLAMLLGGRAAERLLFAELSSGSGGDSGSDLARATRLALRAETGLHLAPDTDLVWHDTHVADRLLAASSDLRDRVSTRLQRAEARALAILNDCRSQLEQGAEIALDVRELDRDALSRLLQDSLAASCTPRLNQP